MFRLLKPHLRIFLINKRTFYEKRNAGYPKLPVEPPETFRKKIQRIRSTFKDEWRLYCQEVKQIWNPFITLAPKGEENVVWKFDGTEKSLKQWIVNLDKDYGHGISSAKLELSSTGTGIFHGILDTRVPKDGRTTRSGYCNITSIPKYKSFHRKIPHDWTGYNELILRVRGDGRCYLINLLCGRYFDVTRFYAFNYVMYTRGGPYWQVVRIPFSKFVFTDKAKMHTHQIDFMSDNIKQLGISIGDKKPGPFRLEIDRISICCNPSLFDTRAYEKNEIERS